MIKHTPGSLKKLGNDQEALDYLNRICAERGGVSCVKEVVFYPKEKELPYLIVETDGFLYKVSLATFLKKRGNDYFLRSCLTPEKLIKHKIDSKHNGDISFVSMDNCEVRGRNKAIFNCKLHGNFSLRLDSAFDGDGCQKCGEKRAKVNLTKSLDDFLPKIKLVHGDKFKYLGSFRRGESLSLLLECEIHGQYTQDVHVHLNGVGCPKCARDKHIEDSVGFGLNDWVTSSNKSNNFDCYKLYVIKCYDKDLGEEFYKVGRTYNKVKKRFGTKYRMPYKYDIISTVGSTDPTYIFNLENKIKKDLAKHKYTPKKFFGGMKECFSIKPIIDEYINEY